MLLNLLEVGIPAIPENPARDFWDSQAFLMLLDFVPVNIPATPHIPAIPSFLNVAEISFG
jgi:hypothetical protein